MFCQDIPEIIISIINIDHIRVSAPLDNRAEGIIHSSLFLLPPSPVTRHPSLVTYFKILLAISPAACTLIPVVNREGLLSIHTKAHLFVSLPEIPSVKKVNPEGLCFGVVSIYYFNRAGAIRVSDC